MRTCGKVRPAQGEATSALYQALLVHGRASIVEETVLEAVTGPHIRRLRPVLSLLPFRGSYTCVPGFGDLLFLTVKSQIYNYSNCI